MKTISLNGIWSLRGSDVSDSEAKVINISAEVPGCVQLDMSREGILPADLFMGMNITEAEKYESYDWWYERTFIAPRERERVFLVFRGVDCIAEYYLNGVLIGESRNMFIKHEFDVSRYLVEGENTIIVHIKSPVKYTHTKDFDISLMAISWMSTPVMTAIRRAPHSYGWDIMPRAVTSGLWRDVSLEIRDEVSFSQVFFDYRDEALVLCYTTVSDWESFKDIEIEVDAACKDDRIYARFPAKHSAARILIDTQKPYLWWPSGYGEPNVYDAALNIYKKGKLIHTTKTSFGIRTLELQRTDTTDGINGCFRFVINGEEIMCKGSNWVPMDAFHSKDAQRYERALSLAKDIGCNILRCWGGNVYEDHAFFDFCDRNGIMVWQDFAMACNTYPQTDEFLNEIYVEAEAIVREYRHHPSIILWSGDNEIDSLMNSLGAPPSQNIVSRRTLPDAVRRNDPSRPYLASSPYIADEAFYNKNLSTSEEHLWGARDYHKSDFHKQSKYHFVSETGYHGCPSLESIRKFITPERVWPYKNNEEWVLHSSDQNGNPARVELMEYQVRQMFGTVPEQFEDYILASQISQAEAKKYFIERMRIGRPHKSGIIWWNLIDGWPQMSDAVVDYFYDKKLAYYYIKRSQRPFMIALDELYDRYQRICACNDTLTDVAGRICIIDSESDEVVYETDFTAARNTTTVIGRLYTEYSEHKMYIIKWQTNLGDGYNHYTTGFIPYELEKYKKWIDKYGLAE